MKLAYALQASEKRTIKRAGINEIAKQYFSTKYHGSADALVDDCIRRDLLEVTHNGDLSFGHLTYQEHLAAEWLAQVNPAKFIWEVIQNPWWKKTIEFYAARKLDLTPVVKYGCRNRSSVRASERVLELVKLAPFTSKTWVLRLVTYPNPSK